MRNHHPTQHNLDSCYSLKKLELLEREEELREESGMYATPKIELDETMREIKALAQQIRDKKVILREETRVNKATSKPTMPRTAGAKVRDRSVSRLRKEMEDLGVDMEGSEAANFTKTKSRARSRSLAGPEAKRMRMDTSEGRSKSKSVTRNRSLSKPRDQQGIKDDAVSSSFTSIACKYMILCLFFWFRCARDSRISRTKRSPRKSRNKVLKVKLIGLLARKCRNICLPVNVALGKRIVVNLYLLFFKQLQINKTYILYFILWFTSLRRVIHIARYKIDRTLEIVR